MTLPPTEYLTVDQAAAFLSVHRQTLHTYVRLGRLPAYKLGKLTRFRADDLRALLSPVAQRKPAGGLSGGPKSTRGQQSLN